MTDVLKQAREALGDLLSGWRYIRGYHGDLYGVGWDRAERGGDAAIAAIDAHQVAAPPSRIDEMALAVARRFTLDTEPQRRASLQCAVIEAMKAAQASPAQQALTEAQCDAFRRQHSTFNDMTRATYPAGRASR